MIGLACCLFPSETIGGIIYLFEVPLLCHWQLLFIPPQTPIFIAIVVPPPGGTTVMS